MEPVSAIGIVSGLVESLGNTFQVLQDFVSRFASEKFGKDFKEAEIAISSSRSDLMIIRSNLHIAWMQSQHDDLLIVLEVAEKRLNNLRDSIQTVQTLRSTFFLPGQTRIPLRREIDDAKSCTVLALEMVEMIRVVQGLNQHAKPPVEASRSNSLIPMSLTEHLPTTWQRSNAPPLNTAPDTKAQQVFAWMAAPEEQDRFHQRCKAGRVTGTCDWFFGTKEYESWRKLPVTTDGRGILWCQGKPGIGKTMLASRIIDRLRTSHFVAYFYMGSGGRLHLATDVVASLLGQLYLSLHMAPRQLYRWSDHERNVRLELDDMLKVLRETSQDINQPILIVIDGWDECDMREQKDFEKVLACLKETSWKILVTSRFGKDIMSKACKDCSQFSIKDDNIRNDVRNFVDSALRGNEPADNMLSDGELRSEVIETLTYHSHGMFYWASLQLRRILDQIHISGIKKALANIPSDVGGIVKDALDMINMQDPARAQLATRTLALLTAPKVPITDIAFMTAKAMSHAMGMSHVLDSNKHLSKLSEDEIPNPESVIECCMGLVAIDPVTKVVKLAHSDIAKYMHTHWEDLFSWTEKLMLANITLAYLSLDAFSTGPCRQADAFIRRLEACHFLDYASRHWGRHAREVMLIQDAHAEQSKQKLTENITRLLDDRMNLNSSLQVCDLNSRPSKVRVVFLRCNEKDFALHADKFSSVSKLQIATRYGFSAIVRENIESHPGVVSRQDDFGTSALHEAAQVGWDDLADMLLKAGAPPSPKNKEGKAPVYYAALNGNTKIVSMISKEENKHEFLLELPGSSNPSSGRNGIAPTGQDPGHPEALEEAFCDAAKAGKLDVIVRLLKANVNLADSKKRGKAAMMFAIQGEHEKILEKPLDAGANLSCPDLSPSGQIPLHQAMRCANENMASMLLDRGVDVQTRDELSRTALFETLDCHDLDGAYLLLYHGIDIFSCDDEGNTVLHEATRKGTVEHASLFIDQGIDLNKFNDEGLTPLHLAAQLNSHRIVRNLLDKGADIDLIDRQAGWTPLMYAASTGSTVLCQILLSRGANVAKVSSDHKTSLMIAAKAGHYDLSKLLLTSGADVNAPGTKSSTPLLLAAAAGHAWLVQLLLEHGADANALDNESHSAPALAAKAGHASTVELLMKYGADPRASKWELETSSQKTTEASNRRIRQLLHDHDEGVDATKRH